MLYRVVRFEDFCLNPYEQTKELFKFLKLDLHSDVINFINTHTRQNSGNAYSTHRDSRKIPFQWRRDMEFSEVKHIEAKCVLAMKLWGYVQANNETSLRNLYPLTNYTLTHDNYEKLYRT